MLKARTIAIFILLGLQLAAAQAQAQQQYNFKVENVELVGARRITLATVLTYVPVKIGDQMTPGLSEEVMHALYKTGFFKDVGLYRRDNVLIIRVTERPAIAEINIEGNKKVKTEDIQKAFDDFDLSRGRIYNDQVLDQMHQELERLYYSAGRYGVKIEKKVTPLPRNRVKIDITIREGIPAKIRQINIVGNESFTDEEILKGFDLGVPAWYTFFSKKDEYAKSKLSGDREKLRSYYMDRGYINFKDESTQVTISPDKKDIYITINIVEGDKYNIRDVSVTVNTPEIEQYRARMSLAAWKINQKGEYFSNAKVTQTIDFINKLLGNQGYAFADTQMVPTIDDKTKEVDINFMVEPKQRVYVQRVLFNGNNKTLDEVYRREMRQMEGAWYSSDAVERSKVRLQRLTFVESAEVTTPAVPGTDDKVDVVFDVKERFSGSFEIGLGYSAANGTAFTTSITQNNLFGRGNALAFSVNKSEVVEDLNTTFTEPYYTDDGISRQTGLFYRQIDTSQTLLSDYVMNSAGGSLEYGIPMNEYSRFGVGITVNHTEVIPSQFSLFEVREFLNHYGNDYDQYMANLSYVYDSRNRGVFPTRGARQQLSAELSLPVSDLDYYKFNYAADYYWPAIGTTLFHLKYNIGLGFPKDDPYELGIPFFEKYVAGGLSTLRGFKSRSIAPRGKQFTTGGVVVPTNNPLGGDLLTVGSLEFVLPPLGDSASMRTVLFYDFGNVFPSYYDFDASEFRTSVGIAHNWLAPIGPMTFSYAKPLEYDKGNKFPGDKGDKEYIDRFDFSVGGTF
jgi:outer membrane protein insertion porin family